MIAVFPPFCPAPFIGSIWGSRIAVRTSLNLRGPFYPPSPDISLRVGGVIRTIAVTASQEPSPPVVGAKPAQNHQAKKELPPFR